MQRFQNGQITSNGNHNIARRVIWKLKGIATKNSLYNKQRVTLLYVRTKKSRGETNILKRGASWVKGWVRGGGA